MSEDFDLRNSVVSKGKIVKESVLEVFLLVIYLVVTNIEGYRVSEFLFQGLGPQNNQSCVSGLLSKKEDRVV